jgi:hypothetical protein
MKHEWIGLLDTDHWSDPIVDGWPVVFGDYVGKRVKITIEEIDDDPDSYENLAKSFE